MRLLFWDFVAQVAREVLAHALQRLPHEPDTVRELEVVMWGMVERDRRRI